MIEHALVGAWNLVSLMTRDAAGAVSYPFGPNPSGQIMFTPSGHMSVIVTSSADGPAGDAGSVASNLLAFSGTYDIEDDIVTYHVQVSIRPEQVEGDQRRRFKFDDDKLILRSVPQPGNEGAPSGEIIWQRL